MALFGNTNRRTQDLFSNMSAGQRFGQAAGNARLAQDARGVQAAEMQRQQQLDQLTRQYKQAQINNFNRVAPVETFNNGINPVTQLPSQQSSISGKWNDYAVQAPKSRSMFKGADGRQHWTDDQTLVLPDASPIPKKAPERRTIIDTQGSKQNQEYLDGRWVNFGSPEPRPAKVPTAGNYDSFTFAKRMNDAMMAMSEIDPTGSVASDWASKTTSELPGGNYLVSSEFQQAEQVRRDLTNAILRKESGAAIGEDEFANANLQYFPQPGDKKEVINNKRLNLLNQYEGMRLAAGPLAIDLPTVADLRKVFSALEKDAKRQDEIGVLELPNNTAVNDPYNLRKRLGF